MVPCYPNLTSKEPEPTPKGQGEGEINYLMCARMSSIEGGHPPQTPGHQWGAWKKCRNHLMCARMCNWPVPSADPPLLSRLDGHPPQPPGHHWGAGVGRGATDLCHQLILPLCPDQTATPLSHQATNGGRGRTGIYWPVPSADPPPLSRLDGHPPQPPGHHWGAGEGSKTRQSPPCSPISDQEKKISFHHII